MCDDKANWFINMVREDQTSFAQSLGLETGHKR